MLKNVCALYESNGRPLAIARRKKPGFIGLPGGKIDPGETPEEAIVREFYEEVGIRVNPSSVRQIFSLVDETGQETATYAVELESALPAEAFSGPEGTEVRLVSWDELTSPEKTEFPIYNQALRDQCQVA